MLKYAACTALPLLLGSAALIFSRQPAFAKLLPGAVFCSRVDSPKTLAAETQELAAALPSGYRTFTIVSDQPTWLRVVVPAQPMSTAMKTIPDDAILATWQNVLSHHHPHCVSSGVKVQYVDPTGKEVFTTSVTL